MERELFVYTHPRMEAFATACFNGQDVVCPINRNTFPNGMPNIKISYVSEITTQRGGANVVYFSQYADMGEKKIEEIIIAVLADTLNVRSLTIVEMYDPLATMERVTEEGCVATANIDAMFWKSLPTLSSGRKIRRLLYDQHTLQNRFYYTGGSTHVVLKSAIPHFIDHLSYFTKPPEPFTIAFPDEGAYKRFNAPFVEAGYDIIVCGKKRQNDKRIVTIHEGDARGKRVIIVDDLVRSGGTLIECMRVLVEQGAAETNVFVTHAEFPNESWRRFTEATLRQELRLVTFFITDTLPHMAQKLCDTPPFEVVSLRRPVLDEIVLASE